VPWLAAPGVSTKEDGENVPSGALRNDPLLSTMEKLWDANPVQNVLPINWVEIGKSLQTLWQRELSDPVNAMQRAADFNAKVWGAAFENWQDAANRFWGIESKREGEEEEGRPDKRFAAPEWAENPFYETLKESYLLASEYLLNEAEATDGQDTDEQRRLKFHLQQFVDAMAPVNYLLTNPEALKRAFETGGASLAEGARNLLTDLEEGRMNMTDATAFQPGENLAITPGKVIPAVVVPSRDATTRAALEEEAAISGRLARVSITIADVAPGGTAAHAVLAGGTEVIVPLEGIIDVERECARLRGELEQLEKQLASLSQRLANQGFISRAPAHVVEAERRKEAEWTARRGQLADKVRALCGQ
jgi:hypothetical protein